MLTRHPLAVLSARTSNSSSTATTRSRSSTTPSSQRYVPALARMLREQPVPFVQVKYEELVREPEAHFRRICDHLGVPFEEQSDRLRRERRGVQRPRRPDRRRSAHAAGHVVGEQVGGGDRANPTDAGAGVRLLDELDPADLETLGYPREKIVAQLEPARGGERPGETRGPLRYRMERKLLVALRRNIQENALGRALKRLRFALDVVLRE